MTYVWLKLANGSALFKDDIYLEPCQTCGERISVCQINDCMAVYQTDDECTLCCKVPCICDHIHDRIKDGDF